MGKKKKSKKKQKPAKKKQPNTTVSSSVMPPSAAISEKPAEIPDAKIPTAETPTAETPAAENLTPDSTSVDIPAPPPVLTESPEEKPEKPETPKDSIKPASLPQSRIRRMLPDVLRVLLALTVIGVGIAIWVKPPLFTASFPHTTFQYKNGSAQEAALYRPLAMQERYYVELPEKLENRYQWFAIDRRREEVALCDEPPHRFFGKKAIRRGDSLGLDLEFRDIDGSEWLIYFYTDAIVFSNNLLSVRLDTK